MHTDFYVIRLISLSAVLGTVSGHLMCVCSHRKREEGERDLMCVCSHRERERERVNLWINAILVLIERLEYRKKWEEGLNDMDSVMNHII